MLVRSVSLLVLLFAVAPVHADEEPPSIVFILADDLGYGDLGCYGCPDIETPHLDRLAAQGLRFTDFYANAPICSPTRMAFLSGRYQQRTGLENALYYQETGRGLPADGKTLADALQSAGYVTGISGKWHVGYDRRRRPLQQGFDHFFGLLGGNHHYFEHMDRIGVHDLWLGDETVERDGYTTDLITEDARDFIRRNRDRPFFLFVSHLAPHFPWQGPEDEDRVVKPKHKSWQQGDRSTYIAMVERMDRGIGKLLQDLDRHGLARRTLVVFTSDNGGHTYSRNEPLARSKGTLWEGGIRVPCIARWPGVLPAGEETAQVGITMDWTATFRRVAGLSADAAHEEGLNLLPMLTGKRPPVNRTLFWRRVKGPVRKNVDEGRAVRRGRWKLIEMADGGRYLYDLQSDTGETHNLVSRHPQLVQELVRELDRWEERVTSTNNGFPSE